MSNTWSLFISFLPADSNTEYARNKKEPEATISPNNLKKESEKTFIFIKIKKKNIIRQITAGNDCNRLSAVLYCG